MTHNYLDTNGKRIQAALDLIRGYGGIDGGHHKQWVLDQVVLELCGSQAKYEEWVAEYQDGEEGPGTYEWDTGSEP